MLFYLSAEDRKPVLSVTPEDETEQLILNDICRAGSDLGAILSSMAPTVRVRIEQPDFDHASLDNRE